MSTKDEVRLVERILAGEAGAFERFISHYRPFIYAILTRHMKLLPEDAEEVFQRFLVRIWEDNFRRLREWRGKASLRAYLGKAVRNLARDYSRERLRDAHVVYSDRLLIDTGLQNAEVRMIIESALSELSDRDRDLIQRRFYLDESYSEIAEALGISINNVGVSLLRAQRRLRKIISRAM